MGKRIRDYDEAADYILQLNPTKGIPRRAPLGRRSIVNKLVDKILLLKEGEFLEFPVRLFCRTIVGKATREVGKITNTKGVYHCTKNGETSYVWKEKIKT